MSITIRYSRSCQEIEAQMVARMLSVPFPTGPPCALAQESSRVELSSRSSSATCVFVFVSLKDQPWPCKAKATMVTATVVESCDA